MELKNKKLLLISSLFCIITIVLGSLRFILENQNLYIGKKSSVIKLSNGWEYTTNTSNNKVSVNLPKKLSIPYGTEKVVLKNTLPSQPIFGGVLRFEVSFQQVDIYIDGKLRSSYGNSEIDNFYYPYYNAKHFIMLDLNPDDFGKKIEIHVNCAKEFIAELSVIRAPQIGEHEDFVVNALFSQSSNILVTILSLMIIGVLIIVSVLRYIKKQKIVTLIGLIFYTLIWMIFYNSDCLLLWEIFNYSPLYSAVNDLKFYVLDSFLPIISFITLQYILKLKLSNFKRKLIFVHVYTYIIATVLHMLAICSINYFRPILMILAIVNFYNIFRESLPKIKIAEQRQFGIGIIILLIGYFLDYIKLLISLLPLSSDSILFLQLKLPPMIFLGIALPIYSGYILYGIVMIFQNEQYKLQQKILIDSLTGVYSRIALHEEFDNIILKHHKEIYYLAMIDVDNFKIVNDSCGHACGDIILQYLGEILTKHYDKLKAFRIGGDEFCILLKGENIKDVTEILTNIKNQFSSRAKKLCDGHDVTISIGVAKWCPPQTLKELINNADIALYRSKNKNKDCISIYEEEYE